MFSLRIPSWLRKSAPVAPQMQPADKAGHQFKQDVAEIRRSVSKKWNFLPSSRRAQREELAAIDKVTAAYEANVNYRGGENTEKLTKYLDAVSSDAIYDKLNKAISTSDKSLQEHRGAKAAEKKAAMQAKPVAINTKLQERAVGSTKLSSDQISTKLSQLVNNLQQQDFAKLQGQGSAGEFLGEKLSKDEFGKIKSSIQKFVSDPKNAGTIRDRIATDGHFSIKKGDIDKATSEHNVSMEGLPRSIVFSQHNGEMQMTVLTKSKVAGGQEQDKDSSAKFNGASTMASRAVTFTTNATSSDLKLGTVIHKTPHKQHDQQGKVVRAVTQEWYDQAATDDLDQARKAPNGMFVEDGGSNPILNYDTPDQKLNSQLEGKKSQIVQGLMQAASGQTTIHGDIKASNILVNNEGVVRIIDLPEGTEEQRTKVKQQTHFSDGFEANNLNDLAGKITSPQAITFMDETTGTSSLGFMADPESGNMSQTGSRSSLIESLGIDQELDEGLQRNNDVISAMHDAFFVNAADMTVPLYNDSWGVLQTAEDLYTSQAGQLSFDDSVDLEVIKDLKREMLNDIVVQADNIPKEMVSEMQALNQQVGSLDYNLDMLCKAVNTVDVPADEKTKLVKGALVKVSRAAGDNTAIVSASEKLSSDAGLSDADLAKGVQGLMQEMIDQRDTAIANIESLAQEEPFQEFTQNMNEKWNTQELASKMGVGVSSQPAREEEKAQSQELVSGKDVLPLTADNVSKLDQSGVSKPPSNGSEADTASLSEASLLSLSELGQSLSSSGVTSSAVEGNAMQSNAHSSGVSAVAKTAAAR